LPRTGWRRCSASPTSRRWRNATSGKPPPEFDDGPDLAETLIVDDDYWEDEQWDEVSTTTSTLRSRPTP
jgi:hypothetical protein